MKGTDRYRVEGVVCRLSERPLPVVNLSVGGLFVASETPPPVGQSVTFDVSLPGRTVALVGQIAWINERVNPRVKALPPGFGIKIVRIAFPDKMALLAFLRETDPSALRKP